jgi:NitT/TauT family transport system permease protein
LSARAEAANAAHIVVASRNRRRRDGTTSPRTVALVYIASVVVFVVAWQWGSASFSVPRLFPGPERTARTLVQLIGDGSLPRDIGASLVRILSGFVIGSIVGFAIGLAMGAFAPIRYVLDPYVNFLRFISGIAWIELATLWLGLGESSKIALVAYVTIFAVAINTLAGFRALPRNRVRAAQSLGASRAQLFFWIELPSCVHFALQGMRLAMAGAFLTVVAAEMVAANSGLGYLIYSSRQFMATDAMFVGILVLGVLGFLADKLLVLFICTAMGRYRLGG